jgi:O-acetyl-ADP-ribose deacetylase (regulator of RNase III)
MNTELLYLIEYLLQENHQYNEIRIPEFDEGQRQLFRALMNVRRPQKTSADFLKMQDEFLQKELASKGIVDVMKLPTMKSNRKIVLWQGDITRLKADAIVNAANNQLLGCFIPCHKCIDNAIHSAAGIQLRDDCYEIMKQQKHVEPTGNAKITNAYNLPSKYVLHTVGPIVDGTVTEKDCLELTSCYQSCLELCAQKNIKSIVFCCISTGEFRFPNYEAALIAIKTVTEYLERNTSIERVIFNVYKDIDYKIYEELLG